MFLAPKNKYCIVFEERVLLSQKTAFKRYDQDMVGFKVKDFPDLERGDTILGKSKLIWKKDLHGVEFPEGCFNAHNAMKIKYSNNVRYLLN